MVEGLAALLGFDVPGAPPAVEVLDERLLDGYVERLRTGACSPGVAVLAPDTIGFEDRRRTGPGREPREGDWLQHYNETASRLLDGGTLMSAILADAATALSLLGALFHGASDERVRFACAGGAACTYRTRVGSGTGIEKAQVIPGIRAVADIDDIACSIAPRPLLLVSATEDAYSEDAEATEHAARRCYESAGASSALTHLRFAGGHDLTEKRFEAVVGWMLEQAGR